MALVLKGMTLGM